MESQAIKEYNDFTGTNGYLIVDGLDDQTPGGKLKVPNYSGVTDGYVLTKTTTNGSDDVVWSAPAGGLDLPSSNVVFTKPVDANYSVEYVIKGTIQGSAADDHNKATAITWYWEIANKDGSGCRASGSL
jgi:hypothetical protein